MAFYALCVFEPFVVFYALCVLEPLWPFMDFVRLSFCGALCTLCA